jgi:ubiquitin carboxyl-terminal hydrolase 8
MQVLSHTYELNEFLSKDSGEYKKRLKNKYESDLIIEWDNLRSLMWQNNCTVSPGKFIKTIQKLAQIKEMDIFTGYAQNDLPEFLLFVIDCFHTSLSREVAMSINGEIVTTTDKMAVECFDMIKKMYTKEYSEIWNMFYAIHVSQIIDLETNEVLSSLPEPYFIIDLPIPQDNKSPSLINCLDLYVDGGEIKNKASKLIKLNKDGSVVVLRE